LPAFAACLQPVHFPFLAMIALTTNQHSAN
jgi:hypothetical protein